jgi:HlyD family secretion protein
MNASADIQTRTNANVLAVPINSVTTRSKKEDEEKSDRKKKDDDDDKDEETTTTADEDIEEIVFVIQQDGKVKKVKVTTDIQDLNYIQILSGLKEGDEVVSGPFTVVSKTLKEGDKVKIVKKEELFKDKDKDE